MTALPDYAVTPDEELVQRADEAARLVATTLFPDLYDGDAALTIPTVYNRIARIIIQGIEEGII